MIDVPVMDQYPEKFRLYQKNDWKKLPGMRWFIKTLVPRHGVTLLFGEPKIGKKSFLGTAMACAVTTGKDWCGFPTSKAKVAYVVGEGFFGILRRQAAWEKLHGEVGDNLRYLRVPINFFNKADVEAALVALKAQGFQPDFIVIDTLARSMSGGKENATEDMSRVFELIEHFRAGLSDAGILVIHHTTKEGLVYRGSSVIPAAVDALTMSHSNDLEITLTSKGFKDAAEFETFAVRCESVDVETEDGVETVLAVKHRVGSFEDIMTRPLNEAENHARQLVKVMAQHSPDGATATKLRKQCEADLGFKKTTFYEALDCAKAKGWIVGGGQRGARYNLHPNGSWREAAQGPAQGSDLVGPVSSP
jgi:hypothetical protein